MPSRLNPNYGRIKNELDDFRDNLSDLGRDDDLRWVTKSYEIIGILA